MANKHRRKTFFENLKPFAHGIGAAIAANKLHEAPTVDSIDDYAEKVEKHRAKLARRAKRARQALNDHMGAAFAKRVDEAVFEELVTKHAPPKAYMDVVEQMAKEGIGVPSNEEMRALLSTYLRPAPKPLPAAVEASEAVRKAMDLVLAHSQPVIRDVLANAFHDGTGMLVIGFDLGSPDGDCSVEALRYPDGRITITKVEYR